MQIRPDWHQQVTHEQFEELFHIEFKGPGWYLSNTDSILVIPLPPNGPANEKVGIRKKSLMNKNVLT